MIENSLCECEQLAVQANGATAPAAPWYGTVAIGSGLLAVPLLIGFVAITDPFAMGMRRDAGQAHVSSGVGGHGAGAPAGSQSVTKAATPNVDPVGEAQLRLTTI